MQFSLKYEFTYVYRHPQALNLASKIQATTALSFYVE